MQQKLTLPENPRPIIIIGAGGIVNDAHLPAYKIAGFNVSGIFDVNKTQAQTTAAAFGIPRVFDSLIQSIAFAPADSIFDLAVPAGEIISILKQLPERSSVLLQKPMG